jgi:hypothetical protein
VDWLATSNALEKLSGVKALLLYFLFSTLYFLGLKAQKIGVTGFEPAASTSRNYLKSLSFRHISLELPHYIGISPCLQTIAFLSMFY